MRKMKLIACVCLLLMGMVGQAGAALTETFSWDENGFVLKEAWTAEFAFDLTSSVNNYARLVNADGTTVSNSITLPSADISSYDPITQSISEASLDFSFYDQDKFTEEVTITASITDGGETLWSDIITLNSTNQIADRQDKTIYLTDTVLPYLQDGKLLTFAIAPNLSQLNDFSITKASLTVTTGLAGEVPIPAALPLLVSGLSVLGLCRRRAVIEKPTTP